MNTRGQISNKRRGLLFLGEFVVTRAGDWYRTALDALPLPFVGHRRLPQVTLALDSQALCCSSRIDEVLKQGLQEFDIAFAVQVFEVTPPLLPLTT